MRGVGTILVIVIVAIVLATWAAEVFQDTLSVDEIINPQETQNDQE